MTQPGWPSQPQRPAQWPGGQPAWGAVRQWNSQPVRQPQHQWGQPWHQPPRPPRRSGGVVAIVGGLLFAGVVVIALAVFLGITADEAADPAGPRTPSTRATATKTQDASPSPTETQSATSSPTPDAGVNPGLPAR